VFQKTQLVSEFIIYLGELFNKGSYYLIFMVIHLKILITGSIYIAKLIAKNRKLRKLSHNYLFTSKASRACISFYFVNI
jgi:hypothetical protein